MVIIVTGGIGSGKSEVCRILSGSYGFPVYEADRKAKTKFIDAALTSAGRAVGSGIARGLLGNLKKII